MLVSVMGKGDETYITFLCVCGWGRGIIHSYYMTRGTSCGITQYAWLINLRSVTGRYARGRLPIF